MKWKEFFKPTKWKVILFFIYLILLFVPIFFGSPFQIDSNVINIVMFPYIQIESMFVPVWPENGDILRPSIIAVLTAGISQLIWVYFISCLIVFVYKRLRKRK